MADNYGLFWNSINADRTYDADSFAEWLRKFFTTGVFNGELQVTPDSGMVVNVAPGYANIEGKVRFFENSNAFTIDPASGVYPRIDNIVVRSDSTARAITCEYVKGDYSGDSPTAPTPTRAGGIYEIVLAQIYVSAGATAILTNDITDTRADDSLCGWVTSTVEGVPMDQIVAQMQADFMAWYDRMKDQLSEDAAGHLQAEIDALQAAIDSAETAIEKHNQSLAIEETGTVAAQMHKKGQYFMLDNRMMVAIADIAEGDTFEFLTNYKHANVGNELSELKSGLTWKRIINVQTTANTQYDQTQTVEDISKYNEIMFTIQRWSNGRTIASTVITVDQFNSAAVYANGSYALYSGVMSQNPSRWINAVAIYKSNTQIELACGANDEALTLRVYVR